MYIKHVIFQSTRPSRASTTARDAFQAMRDISIHKALAGLDDLKPHLVEYIPISIHKALAGLDRLTCISMTWNRISIHKALAGLDVDIYRVVPDKDDFNPQGPRGPRRYKRLHEYQYLCISIHKALAGLDCGAVSASGVTSSFQSTRPSRASTKCRNITVMDIYDFNPQGPRGPRLLIMRKRKQAKVISIHKALAGLDREPVSEVPAICGFQSTRPSRASTIYILGLDSQPIISIHKALAGLDT